MVRRALLIVLLLSASTSAQRVTLTFRNCVDVADKTIEGMSGVTYTGVDDTYWVVLDNSNRIVKFQFKLAADGSIQSCKILGEVKLFQKKDFEGIAFTSPARNSVFLADESPGITEYRLSDGRPIRLVDVPGVFKHVVPNQGFESLSLSPDGKTLWTANERALVIDGNLKVMAEPMFATTRCRLQRFTIDGESIKPSGQYLYRTSGVHDIGGQIGLCDLVAMPDGRLLALERSAGKNLSDFYSVRTRIFLIDTKEATDITGPAFDAGLPKDDQAIKLVGKTLLYDGFVCDRDGENLEGLCLGPPLGPDRWAVIGVVDSTDGPMQVSQSRVVAFVLNLKGAGDAFGNNHWQGVVGSVKLTAPVSKSTARYQFDPIPFLEAATREPKAFAFTAKTAAAARTWQRKARAALAERLGFLDTPRVAPGPREIHRVDRGAYVRHKIVIRTSKQSELPLYLLVPKNIRGGKRPAVMALAGHGYGAKDLVGLWEDGTERNTPDGTHRDFADQLARRGFVVVAPEISCFGERQFSNTNFRAVGLNGSCHNIATWAMMLGRSVAGLRVMDGMRVVDFLQGHKFVDPDRIGVMGLSGGGMHAFFSSAIDPRIKAAVISGYFCDWRQSILSIFHCTCNFVPGLLELGELSDLAALIAPRPTLVENGIRDDIFPIEHVKRTVAKARRAWKVFGANENLATDYFEGRHRINGPAAYDFLARHLQLEESR